MKILLITLAICLGAILGGHLKAAAAESSTICIDQPNAPLCETWYRLHHPHMEAQ